MSTKPKRTKQIKIKMLEEEYQLAKEKAAEYGYPLATFARHVVLSKHIKNRKQDKINASTLAQIAWIGNNLNQIARAVNTAAKKDEIDLMAVNFELAAIRSEVEHLLEVLGVENDN